MHKTQTKYILTNIWEELHWSLNMGGAVVEEGLHRMWLVI